MGNIDKALQMLSQIELYALECYNVTERHKAEISLKKSKKLKLMIIE